MSLDTRLVKLRTVWEARDITSLTLTADYDSWVAGPRDERQRIHLVDPLLESKEGLAPVYVENTNLLNQPLQPMGKTKIGYGWVKNAPKCARPIPKLPAFENLDRAHGGLPAAIVQPTIESSRSDTDKTVVVQGGSTKHTIKLVQGAGGHIRSWTVEGPLGTHQWVNHMWSWNRGVQMGLEWTDAFTGEFIRHNAVQGGNYYAKQPYHAQLAFGSPLHRQIAVEQSADDRAIIDIGPMSPAEFDPDGRLSIPGVSSHHYGALAEPVLWRNLRFYQRIHVNYLGQENLHLLDTFLVLPFDIETVFFDVNRYHVLAVNDTIATRLRGFNEATGYDAVLAESGKLGQFYERDYQRFVAFPHRICADDNACVRAGMLGDRPILGAGGANVGDFHLCMGAKIISALYPKMSVKHGNNVGWVCNWGGAGGEGGDNVVALTHGHLLSSHVHPSTAVRKMDAGEYYLKTFFTTADWTNGKNLLKRYI